jgi:hypothetical protein
MVFIHVQSKCRNKKDKSEVQFWSFLTSTLNGQERLPSHPDHFTPRQRTHGTHTTDGWRAPQPVRTFWRRRKNSFPLSGITLQIIQPTAQSL